MASQDPQFPKAASPSLPGDHIFGGPASRQPAPCRRRTGPPVRHRAGRTARILSLEASAALHLALLLFLMGLPMPQPAPKEAQREIVPIEVTFLPQPMVPTIKAAPPGPPAKPVPEPLPRAPERPAPRPVPQQAAAPRPLPPRHADVARRPAPRPAQHEVPRPRQPDLQALLNARMNQSQTQEEQRLARLREAARTGAAARPVEPAVGQPTGDPTTGGSGLSGALAAREPLRRVFPTYPGQAQRIGEEGEVRLRLYVAASGAVSRVEVLRSSGRGYFDRAAAAAIRQWAFNPLAEGGGGEQYGDITLYFQLQ